MEMKRNETEERKHAIEKEYLVGEEEEKNLESSSSLSDYVQAIVKEKVPMLDSKVLPSQQLQKLYTSLTTRTNIHPSNRRNKLSLEERKQRRIQISLEIIAKSLNHLLQHASFTISLSTHQPSYYNNYPKNNIEGEERGVTRVECVSASQVVCNFLKSSSQFNSLFFWSSFISQYVSQLHPLQLLMYHTETPSN